MKQNLPMPVIIGVVVAVMLVVVVFFVKGVTAEPHTPHPDRSLFMKTSDNPAPKSP